MTDPVTPFRDSITLGVQLMGMLGTAIAFACTLVTWRDGQRWQRASKLDDFIQYFEADELLQLARVMIDWPTRSVEFRGKEFTYSNRDVLVAIGAYGQGLRAAMQADATQARLRDAVDTILAFFVRLDTSVHYRLIDEVPARAYFGYWLERLVSMDRHPTEPQKDGEAEPLPAAKAIALYIQTFGDGAAIRRLEKAFRVQKTMYELPAGEEMWCMGS